MKKAALYIRVSTHHQIDKDSLPFQRKELINYSKYILGIDDYEIFEDAGYSGKNTDRPAYQDMMLRIKNGEFTHLLVWKIDRISRNLKDFTEMYEDIKRYGIVFISKNEQFDTSTAMGEAMLKIILVFAELERKLTAERVSSIMLSRAEKGLWNGANCPIGYKWNDESKFPAVDDEESKTVQYIYDKYEEHSSAHQVMIILNSNHIKTKRGGTWTSKTVVDIIRNPFYKGTYRYNYRESARGKKKDKSEWIIVDDNHEAIISKDQWTRCNEIMDKNAERNTALLRSNSYTHVFSGLIKCAQCGRGFIANLDRPRNDGYRPSVYRCRGKRNALGCDAKMTTEVKIGPFVVNYLSNLLKAHSQLTKKHNLKDFERILLKGQMFNDIAGIENKGLESTYTSMLYSNLNNILIDKPINEVEKKKDISELSMLQKEKEKYERAIERLQSLYLFSDEAMSEKDFLIQKKKLKDKIKDVNVKLQELHDHNSSQVAFNDLTFLQRASHFWVVNKLIGKKEIDYKNLVMSSDKELVKDFMNTVIDKVVADNGRITSIYFKNGLSHTFIYRT